MSTKLSSIPKNILKFMKENYRIVFILGDDYSKHDCIQTKFNNVKFLFSCQTSNINCIIYKSFNRSRKINVFLFEEENSKINYSFLKIDSISANFDSLKLKLLNIRISDSSLLLPPIIPKETPLNLQILSDSVK
jgi:hypothetical protein